MDFMFMGDGSIAEKTAVLVIKERIWKMLAATVVPWKSTGEYAVIGAKPDNEPAIVDLVELRAARSP